LLKQEEVQTDIADERSKTAPLLFTADQAVIGPNAEII